MLWLVAQLAVQTDWYGGPGVLGPVASWGNTFYASENVNYANPGRISLVAVSWSFSSWVRHLIDPNSPSHYQGFSAHDINGDGYKDLILISGNWVRWLEYVSDWNYTPHNVGYLAGIYNAYFGVIWADDMDGDGDMDILVGDNYSVPGVYIFWNEDGQGLTWTAQQVSTRQVSQLFTGDLDGDGLPDILVANRNYGTRGVWWYRNNGGRSFTEINLWNLGTSGHAWRLAIGDLDLDGDLDFVATGGTGNWYPHVFINDGSGNFTRYDYNLPSDGVDGMWLNDLDLDGDLDITCVPYRGDSFYVYLNSGDGVNYTVIDVAGPANAYGDGSIAYDMDMDGLPDIVGYYDLVGYFRQNWWPNFSEYRVGSDPEGHWVYPDDLDQGTCAPDIDILISGDNGHVVYENQMVAAFADTGYLISSILDLTGDPNQGGQVAWLGWGDGTCVPNDTAVAIYWRVGRTVAEIQAAPWQGPIMLPAHSGADSVRLYTDCVRYFQYKIVLKADNDPPRDAPTFSEIFIRWTSCPLYEGVEDAETGPSRFSLKATGGTLTLEVPYNTVGVLRVYDTRGRLVEELLKGRVERGVHTFKPQLPAGIYVAQAKLGGVNLVAKLTVR